MVLLKFLFFSKVLTTQALFHCLFASFVFLCQHSNEKRLSTLFSSIKARGTSNFEVLGYFQASLHHY